MTVITSRSDLTGETLQRVRVNSFGLVAGATSDDNTLFRNLDTSDLTAHTMRTSEFRIDLPKPIQDG
jgi:hypothetical protein